MKKIAPNIHQYPEWLTVEGVAAYLSVSKETVYRLIDKRKIPKHRLGKLWRFNTKEITQWMLRK